MIRSKSFVTERTFDFIMILQKDFPGYHNYFYFFIFFTSSFPRFSVISLTGYTGTSLSCVHVSNKLFVSMFFKGA